MVNSRGLWISLCLLQLTFRITSAGQTGQTLSSDVSRPLYLTMTGVEDPENAIIELIEEVSDDPASLRDCTSGGDGCKVASFIVGCIVAGSIVLPALTFFCCCGFCCGRTCCKCCGKPCCGENCGGKYPTKKYKWMETIKTLVLLIVTMIILFVFSGLGFRAFSEIKGDYDNFLDAGLVLARVPLDVIDDTNAQVDIIKGIGLGLFESINDKFSVVEDVKDLNTRLDASLEKLKREMIGLQLLVEGCDASAQDCIVPVVLPGQLPDKANPCVGGSHPAGQGAQLSNGNENPACRNPEGTAAIQCPCCTACQDIIADIEVVQAALPSMEDLNDLNQSIDVGLIDSTIDEAMGDWDSSLTDFEDQVEPVEDFVTEAKGAVTAEQVDGIAAGLFLLTWIVLICVIAAILLSVWRSKLGDLGGWCWWGGFIICVIYIIFIVAPMFGWMTAIALPMESVCGILPAQGENSDDLFRLLEASGSTPPNEVKVLIDECVLASDGYIWSSANVTRQSLSNELNGAFNVSQDIANVDVDSTLDVSAQTADFNQTEVNALTPATYGVSLSCPQSIASQSARCGQYIADMNAYASDLNASISRAKAAAAGVAAVIADLERVAADTQASIDQIKVDAEAAVDEILDGVWELGKCTRISNAYEGLRVPLCDGVAAGVFGTWGVLFIMAFFLYLLLYLINKSAKLAYARRHPEGNPDEASKVHPDGETEVVPGSEGTKDKLYPNQESN